MLKLLRDRPGSEVVWVVFSANGQRKREAKESAKIFLGHAGSSTIITKAFRESFFPYDGKPIKDYFEHLKSIIDPDLIFTHYRQDAHQDHRLISELTWNTFRSHQIFEYEIPKYDGDLGQPNMFIPLTEAVCKEKVRHIINGFVTQHGRTWFTEDTFYAFLRLRGMESGASEKYAEAFYGRKIVLGVEV